MNANDLRRNTKPKLPPRGPRAWLLTKSSNNMEAFGASTSWANSNNQQAKENNSACQVHRSPPGVGLRKSLPLFCGPEPPKKRPQGGHDFRLYLRRGQ